MKYALIHATLWTVTHGVIEDGVVLVEDGKIAALGSAEDIVVPAGMPTLDACGQIVTPGLVDAESHVGLYEEGIGWAGDDLNETTDPNTAHVRPLDGIYPTDIGFDDCRQGGVTTIQVAPGHTNVLAGEMHVLKTRISPIVDAMVVKALSGIKASLGEDPKAAYVNLRKMPTTRMGTASVLRTALYDAQSYLEKKQKATSPETMPPMDMRKESLAQVLSGAVPLHIRAVRADDIATALRIAKEFGIAITLDNCSDGHIVAAAIAEAGVPVCLGPTLAAKSKVEFKELGYHTAVALADAGVPLAIVTAHPEMPAQYLNLSVALAIRDGLDEQIALEAVTITPAKMMGLEASIGSLEVGKDADLVVWNGEPFELLTEAVLTIIDGHIVWQHKNWQGGELTCSH